MRLFFSALLVTLFLTACDSGRDLSSAGDSAPALAKGSHATLNLLVIGGTKGVGLETVRLALERGHRVTATARRPERMTLTHERLKTIKGDITDAASMLDIVAGHDAVAVAVGIGPTREPVTVFSEGMKNVLLAMNRHGVKRLSFVTGIGAGDSRGHGSFFYDNILQPLALKTVYADKDIAEGLVSGSVVDWTIVRPGFLTDDASSARYRVIEDMTNVTAGDISRADVAHFIIATVESPGYLQKIVLLTDP